MMANEDERGMLVIAYGVMAFFGILLGLFFGWLLWG